MARIPEKLLKLIARLDKKMVAAFSKAILDLKRDAQIKELVSAIQRNNLDAVYDALGLSRAVFAPLEVVIREAFLEGGVYSLESVRNLPSGSGAGRMVLRFDGRHTRAERWVAEHSSNLIQGIVDDTKEAVRSVVQEGLENGRGPRKTALEITGRINPSTGRRTGGILGLTRSQTDAVIRARAELASGDPRLLREYLDRGKRDKRFDAMVRRAIEGKSTLSPADVERIIGRYKDRLLAYRGEVIARTETLSSMNSGREEGIRQLVESGKVRYEQVQKTWRATGDTRTRDTHRFLNGTTVGLDDPFITAEGHRLMHPHDQSLGAPGSEIIQCRCFYELKIRYL